MKQLTIGLLLLSAVFLVAPPAEAAITVSTAGLQGNINATRANVGLPRLRRNARLDMAAKIRAQALLKQARLTHGYRAQSVASILRQVGYRARTSGELLAADYPSSVATVRAWSNSTIHRSILVSPRFKDIGVAVIHTPPGSPFRVISVVVVAQNSGL